MKSATLFAGFSSKGHLPLTSQLSRMAGNIDSVWTLTLMLHICDQTDRFKKIYYTAQELYTHTSLNLSYAELSVALDIAQTCGLLTAQPTSKGLAYTLVYKAVSS